MGGDPAGSESRKSIESFNEVSKESSPFWHFTKNEISKKLEYYQHRVLLILITVEFRLRAELN